MAWLARSIANTLLAPEDPDEGEDPRTSASGSASPPRGVREDLSELTGALAHRFQGLASFLAPADADGGGAPGPADQAVADLAKIASSLLPPEGGDGDAAEAPGFTEEAVAFARDAAMRPELWLDFPLLPDDADSDDFDMTDAQQDHALAVESVAPELADLRIELCPSHMSEGCFWKIYFVLLHPKLTKDDADLLSTPQILEARKMLSHNLQHESNLDSNDGRVAVPFSNIDGNVPSPVAAVGTLKNEDDSARATAFSNVDYGTPQPVILETQSSDMLNDAGALHADNITSSIPVQLVPVLKDSTEFSQSRMEESTHDFTAQDTVANEQPGQSSEITLQASPEERRKEPSTNLSEQSRVVVQKTNDDDNIDDGDEWLEEETGGGAGNTTIPMADDEDVSFSDLEEDDA
uniref:BSD domain-containing protein n=1 Tax=Oryza brachyantha TaxID=4533 RepID=J3N915_ORYBR